MAPAINFGIGDELVVGLWYAPELPRVGEWFPLIGGTPARVVSVQKRPDHSPAAVQVTYRLLRRGDVVLLPEELSPWGYKTQAQFGGVSAGRCRFDHTGVSFWVPADALCRIWNDWQKPNFLGEGI